MSVISQQIYIDALGPKGAYRTHNRQTITDVTGHPLAELSLVPRLFVTRAMTALHKAKTLPLEDRLTALARAGELFATGEVDGMSAASYQRTVCRMSGTPLSTVRSAVEAVAYYAAKVYWSAQQARPNRALPAGQSRRDTSLPGR